VKEALLSATMNCPNKDQIFKYPLRWPSTALVCAPSFSGKTWFLLDLIKQRKLVYNTTISKVVYVYSNMQDIFESFSLENKEVTFTKDIPNIPEGNKENTLIIFDDCLLTHETKDNQYITELFVALSHHRNISALCSWQTLFPKSLKTVSSNATYFIIFPMRRDKSSLDILNRQILPEFPGFIRNAMNDVEKTKYQYLLVDCSSQQDDMFRVRNFIYPKQDAKVYIPSEM
jgi:hypothetical protein